MIQGSLLALSLGVLSLALLLNGCGRWVDSWVYQPRSASAATPASRGVDYEDLTLEAADGVRLHAWWIPGKRDGPAIVFLHGNAGSLSDRVDLIQRFAERLGLPMLSLEYRGYGTSSGRPSQPGLVEDAGCALREARSRVRGPVVFFGRSLGAAVALHAALRYPPDGLVLEGTFTRVEELARLHYPVLSWPFRRRLAGMWDNLAAAARQTVPALFLHGDKDRVVPIGMAWRVYDRYAGPKTFRTVVGAGHDDPAFVGGDAYWEAWEGFLDLLSGAGAEKTAGLKEFRPRVDPEGEMKPPDTDTTHIRKGERP
ncbi:alpha/beta hydrolase [Deferrisoma camini]|uniref:alpha/beta hydrolase n=1 Tax=Deferrisoma camini TaxID=1035120 RepID=UPI00046D4301|nr:alpha/beta hydrolase [Deferrisoma camini]